MKRALELAEKALGNSYPNPVVGCVIVYDDKIIGEGYHKKAGEPHAEINAINSVKNPELLKDSTIYVTLEPCAHYGRTPPCALKIVETGFKKVVIGTLDSHEKVNGKGVQIIKNAGIQVETGILEEECKEINKRFFTYHQKKRPYIILKWAQSADRFIDKDFHPVQISNRLASQYVHKMRAEENAILVGTHTALSDNPSLTVRSVAGNNPVRILIDFDLKVPMQNKIFNNEAPTLVVNARKNGIENNIKFFKVKKENFLLQLMDILYREQIQSLIVEGGSHTLQQFISAGLWDEAVIIKNPSLYLFNGTKAPEFSHQPTNQVNFGDNTIEFYKK